MALSASEQNHITHLAQFAQQMTDLRNIVYELNYQWNGAPDFDTTVTQQEIDAIPSLAAAGLTKTDMTEVEYVAAVLLGLIDDKFPQLLQVKEAQG